MKNQARKEQQEETFKKIQDDLEMWQKELRNFHERVSFQIIHLSKILNLCVVVYYHDQAQVKLSSHSDIQE